MRTLLNIIWFFFAGIGLWISYAAVGVIAFITIIGIPAGIACFRIGNYSIWPFGREVVRDPDAGAWTVVGNILWIPLGLILAIAHVVTAVTLAITIIGIPMAWANLKLIPISLTPMGRIVVETH
ncbi:YccF domain-containing protein [Demequina lignilytica]|uniref:YccF domain-containing protein n=1 Tax=Demequina lignilytica TaxID=3051663 RepID=A0AB35MKR5_9MICO|nr:MULTISPECIES: YccF domain-containing protein [unclassified Demequina]MDN4484406.1 YccF domain-containing protein [Demequina sp. SYSU T0a273]MDN4491893.1 YccF domain-containing protein [Demequina sp. SYSU T00068]